jgi:tetratricopeptide (TPR) repeat protein
MWCAATLLLLALAQSTDFAAEGFKALEAKQYAVAAQQFAKAVEADPKDYAAHFHLALSQSLLGKDDEAITEYKKTLELKPGLYEAEVNLGMLLVEQKQPREAVGILEAAVAQKPQEIRPNLYLADALLAAGDFAKAEQQFVAAGKLDPKSAAVELGLGRSRARQDRLEEAAVNFRKAAELDPSFKDSVLELASLQEGHGQDAAAIALYRTFPENNAAQERLAMLLVKSGKPAEAAPVLEQILAREPQNLALRMMHGRALRDMKKYPAAAAEFSRVVQAKPESVEAWNELAGMLVLIGDYPRALTALDRLNALGAAIPGHFFLRAIILDKTGQFQPALENYEKFLSVSGGKNPDEEFQARQRVRILRKELNKR